MSQFIEQKVAAIIESTLNTLGFDLVRVRMSGATFKVLEVLVDRLDGQKISVADCRSASRNISALLDVEDVIKDKYYLEVASPGVERPLMKVSDYTKFLGYVIKVRLKEKIHGAGHYQGKIEKVDGQQIYLHVAGNEIIIDFDLIKSANLVLTDEIFKQLLNKETNK